MSNNQLMNAAQVAAWYDKHFVKKENQNAIALISITIDEETLTIPGYDLHPHHSIDDIIRGFHHYLKENGPLDDSPISKAEAEFGDIENFHKVSVRKSDYMVEKWIKDGKAKYRVARMDNRSVIDPKSPTWRSAIKEFHKMFPE